MGQSLSEPVTEKKSSNCENLKFRVGSSSMQGWRVTMEDSHTHILSLLDDPGTAFFAVYDGHGGDKVSKYAGDYLHKFVLQRPEYKDNKIEIALKQAFLDIDNVMLQNKSILAERTVGCTAVVVLVKDNMLYCANAGDSRAIACVNGQVMALSMDHKPNNELEMRRIQDGGGWVQYNRINGDLALSRALGDFCYKSRKAKPEDQIVTAYPDVETRKMTEDWEFIVLACDGIWDVMTNQDVSDFCRLRIARGMRPEDICEELMDHCLAPTSDVGSMGSDNMTVVLACVLNGKPYSDLIARCKDDDETLYKQAETNPNPNPNSSYIDLTASESENLQPDDNSSPSNLAPLSSENELQENEMQQDADNADPLPGESSDIDLD